MRFQSLQEQYGFSLLCPDSMYALPTDQVVADLRQVSERDFGSDLEAWLQWLRTVDLDEAMKQSNFDAEP